MAPPRTAVPTVSRRDASRARLDTERRAGPVARVVISVNAPCVTGNPGWPWTRSCRLNRAGADLFAELSMDEQDGLTDGHRSWRRAGQRRQESWEIHHFFIIDE